ncbi:MAG: SDR family NAD(P)-dependent oxidoreductase, partial [Bdellovibrionota bacterium]|nr:SDR family NAD(P)-dependent oxidoreductase [Bdellovibrionota bacterium]
MIKEASILGCGWLGGPLASELNNRGWGVKGSTTTSSKLPFLDSFLKSSFLVDIDNLPENIGKFLSSDVLIISLPPKLNRRDKPFEFLEKLVLLRKEVSKSPLTKVLYISSTSVYGENQGKVDEDTTPKPDSIRGEV